jgi:hypothetical protein
MVHRTGWRGIAEMAMTKILKRTDIASASPADALDEAAPYWPMLRQCLT